MWDMARRQTARLASSAVVALAALASGGSAAAAGSGSLAAATLSNRADLISGGDALVEIVAPKTLDARQITVRLNGADVSARFARRADGRILGRVEGLVDGPNTLTASVGAGAAQQLLVTNHPVGGPVFSGPQMQPWRCDTQAVAVGLGPATDAECNAPTRYRLVYKHAVTGKFRPYDPAEPPSPMFIARTKTDAGKAVPYVVRIETGTINRGVYDIAVLFDPSQPWEPWAPQAGWNGKLLWVFGCALGTAHRQGKDRGCYYMDGGVTDVLDEAALSRGFMVAASTQTNLGNDVNTVVLAETLMMAKEHIVERYGEIRYTIGQGASGGAITQHAIAEQYPGLLDGLRPGASFPDPWSIIAANGHDCGLLNRYFDKTSPGLWRDAAQRDAVYGFGMGGPEDSGGDFCHGKGAGSGIAHLWLPQGRNDAAMGLSPCVPEDQLYDPRTNPTGVRCTAQDYMVNVFGRRPPSAWGPVEKAIGRGFAKRMLDRVGVQYGLKALEAGTISPEQFVDLNEKIGGWDIDAEWRPQRTEADPGAVEIMYRTGQIVEGRRLADVAIIDYRRDVRSDLHSNRQAAYVRDRLKAVNGTAANRAEWLAPRGRETPAPLDGGGSAPIYATLTFPMMDAWLAAVEADRSGLPRAQKIIRNRPADAADGCFVDGKRAESDACAGYALDGDPLMAAGMPPTRDILKCRLKPLRRGDYKAAFTEAQWARLRAAFPTGVCDWRKPGAGQQPNVPWLTFADGPGGKPLPPAPRSAPAGRR